MKTIVLTKKVYICNMKKKREKHGWNNTPEYSIYKGMRQRCYNENNSSYKNYGKRGIKVCKRWIHSFKNFIADMGPRPSKKHTLERIKNNKDYGPNNCRWATRLEQSYNKRNTFINFFTVISIDGIEKPIGKWIEEYKITPSLFKARIRNIGLSVEEAITKPKRAYRYKECKYIFNN